MNFKSWPYTFPLPLAANQKTGYSLRQGVNLELVGVDGRVGSALRRFPGFLSLRTLDVGAFSSGFSSGFYVSGEVSYSGFFRYAEIQKGDTGHSLRGFVHSQTNGSLIFSYYDTGDDAWEAKELYAAGTITDVEDLDVSFAGKFLYVALLGTVGLSCFYWNGAVQTLPFGYQGSPAIANLISSNVGGLLEGTTGQVLFWTVGVRFGDSRRNVWSPLVTQDYPPYDELLVEAGGASYHLRVQVTVPSSVVDTYDTVEVYRTITSGGVLHREIYHHVPTETGNANATLRDLVGETDLITGRTEVVSPLGYAGGNITVFLGLEPTYALATGVGSTDFGASTYWYSPYLRGGLSDSQLGFQEDYDPDADDPGDIPKGNRAFATGGMVVKTDADTAAPMSQIRWSRSDVFQPETFPSTNIYRTGRSSDRVARFVANGDFVYALTKNRAYRMQKVGGAVGWERVAHGTGARSYHSAVELPASLATVTPSHLTLISPQGAISNVSLLDQVMVANRDEYKLIYDSVGECLFIVHPDDAETAYCLWGSTNAVTALGPTRFVAATSGPHPDTSLASSLEGLPERAFFLCSNGVVLYPDFDTGATTSSSGTFGVAPLGEVFAGAQVAATTITSSFGATNRYSHCFLYVVRAAGSVTRHRVASNTTTVLTLSDSITCAAGDRWVLGTIPFQWAGWPLWDQDDQSKVLPNRRITRGMNFDVRSVAGIGDLKIGGFFFNREFRPFGTGSSPTPAEEITPDYTAPDKNWVNAQTGYPTTIPCIYCVDGGRIFELLQVTVKASVEDTDKTSSG